MHTAVRSSVLTALVVLVLCNSLHFATMAIICLLWFIYLSAGELFYHLLFSVFTYIPSQRMNINLIFLFWSVFLVSSDALITWRGMIVGYLFLARLTEHLKSGVLFWDELCRVGKAEVVIKACLVFFCGILQIMYLISLPEGEMSPLASHPLIQTVMRHSTEQTREYVFSYPSLDSMLRKEMEGGESKEQEGLRLLALVATTSTVIEIFFVIITLVLLLGGFALCESVWGAWRHPLSEGLDHTMLDPRSERIFFIPNLLKQLFCSLFCFWFLVRRSHAFLLQCVLGVSTYLFCDDWSLLQTERDALSGIPLCVVTESETSCCICLDEIPVSHAARRLPCGHLFHSACLRKWIVRHRECPLCRGGTTVDASLFPQRRSSFQESFADSSSPHAERPDASSSTPTPAVLTTIAARRLHRVTSMPRQPAAEAEQGQHLYSLLSPSYLMTPTTTSTTTSSLSQDRVSRIRNFPLPSIFIRQSHASSLPPSAPDSAPALIPSFLLRAQGSVPFVSSSSVMPTIEESSIDQEDVEEVRDEGEMMTERDRVEVNSLHSFGFGLGNAFRFLSQGITGVSISVDLGHEDSYSSSSSNSSSSDSDSTSSYERNTITRNANREEVGGRSRIAVEQGENFLSRQANTSRNDGVQAGRETVLEEKEEDSHRIRTRVPRAGVSRSLSSYAPPGEDTHEVIQEEGRIGRRERNRNKMRKMGITERNSAEIIDMTTFEDVSLLQSTSPLVVSTSLEQGNTNVNQNSTLSLSSSTSRKRPRSSSSTCPKGSTVEAEKSDETPRRRKPRRGQ